MKQITITVEVPDWVEYFLVDSHGAAFVTESEPTLQEGTHQDNWTTDGKHCRLTTNWRDTLRKV